MLLLMFFGFSRKFSALYVCILSRVSDEPVVGLLVGLIEHLHLATTITRSMGIIYRSLQYRSASMLPFIPAADCLTANQSQSYLTTGGLPQISLGVRPLETHDQILFFSTEPLRPWLLCNILSDEKMGLSPVNMLGVCQVYISHIQHVIEIFLLLHYTEVLCPYRLYRVDHAYLTHLMLQWQLSHLNGCKLDHLQV
jgi:hypothetical protein